jgi:Zn-dependent peptidase ImmA (M78 family)
MRSLTLPERLLQGFGVEAPEDIDLEAIAWALGVRVKYKALETCEARIIGKDNRAIVTVDTSRTPQRRRYSLAHELGHWHYHRGQCLACRAEDIGNAGNSATNPERIADDYASDLVLPRYLLEPLLNKQPRPTLAAIREIAERFNASLTATLLKIIEANQYSIVVVCHSQAGRRWFRRSAGIPERWFPRDDLDHESSSFPLLFGKGAEEKFPRRIGADAWFDQRDAANFELLEQSFALPDNNVCTILTFTDPDMFDDN